MVSKQFWHNLAFGVSTTGWGVIGTIVFHDILGFNEGATLVFIIVIGLLLLGLADYIGILPKQNDTTE